MNAGKTHRTGILGGIVLLGLLAVLLSGCGKRHVRFHRDGGYHADMRARHAPVFVPHPPRRPHFRPHHRHH